MQAMLAENAPYKLRWRFDYKDKNAVFGMWNSPHIEAWNKNSDKVVRASIEVQSQKTFITQTIVECDGHDFRNFQWIAIARVNPNFKGSVSPEPEHVGLKLLTTEDEVAVLVDGQCAKRKLTTDEKGLQLATFGR